MRLSCWLFEISSLALSRNLPVADDIATFLGKKLNGNHQDEMGNRYNVRIEGRRVRHSMGMSSIKMYDKFGRILRIETSTLDVTFFQHYRQVEQRDGTIAMEFAR